MEPDRRQGPAIVDAARSRVTRRWMVSALACGIAAPALANAPGRSPLPPPRPSVPAVAAAPAQPAVASAEALIEAARLGGRVGFAVADAAGGEILEARHPEEGQPPASVVKALTADYARVTLGDGHRFGTWVTATGPVQGDAVAGDLVLLGGGDPTLDTDRMAALAAALAARGVRRVTGRFLVQGGALPTVAMIDREQPEHVGYNPSVSGLNLNYNRVHFRWQRNGAGHSLVMDAPGERHNTAVSVASVALADRREPVYALQSGAASDSWTVARAALGDNGSRWLPVRHPELYAGDVFRGLAAARGVALPAPQLAPPGTPRGTVLAEDVSPPLSEILSGMMRWSTNLTAEVVGLAATQARGMRPSGLAQSAQAMADWAAQRYGIGPARLVDHSGLGDGSRLGPAAMVRFLAHPQVAAGMRGLMRDQPMRDGAGTPQPNHPVRVAAKTGTLNFVNGLAGYARRGEGRELVFAIFAADLDTRSRIPPALRERPAGGREWAARARRLQQQLIERWTALHG